MFKDKNHNFVFVTPKPDAKKIEKMCEALEVYFEKGFETLDTC